MVEQHEAEAFAWEQGLESARVIVPLVMKFVRPSSVVDVGCGVGAWLSVFKKQGIADIAGIDNDWVDRTRLMIPPERFFPKNLEQPFSHEKVDLAVSLETAEHLAPAAAADFVASLVALAPVILFSAAIPHQGGVHHVNEQWPEYWAKLFAEHGYIPVDCLRRRIWDNERVKFWFKQNTFIYVRKESLAAYPALQKEVEAGHDIAHALVHPYKYLYFAERWERIVPWIGRLPVPLIRLGKRMLAKF